MSIEYERHAGKQGRQFHYRKAFSHKMLVFNECFCSKL